MRESEIEKLIKSKGGDQVKRISLPSKFGSDKVPSLCRRPYRSERFWGISVRGSGFGLWDRTCCEEIIGMDMISWDAATQRVWWGRLLLGMRIMSCTLKGRDGGMHDMCISDGKDPQHSHTHTNVCKYHPDHDEESPVSSMCVMLSGEISGGSLFKGSKTDLLVFRRAT